jgi:hypothetical protein
LKKRKKGINWKKKLKKIRLEIENVEKVEDKDDEMVKVVMEGIKNEDVGSGVYKEEEMRERLIKVESIDRRLELIKEEGGSMKI